LETNSDRYTSRDRIRSTDFEMGADREHLADLFRSQRHRLFHAALRMLGNAEDAEDAVQEGLLSAIRNFHRFEGRARLSTWLTRIVLNAALMRLRSLRAHESVPMDEPVVQQGGVRPSEFLVDSRPNPEEACARAEQRWILNQALKGLSLRQRQAIALRDFHGMSSKEAARILGRSEGTVKSQVHRARRQLSRYVRGVQQSPALASLARA
jgi:RNA polymerase sigma-70 factor, ECF subfamily